MRSLLRMLPIALLIGIGLPACADERGDADDFDRAVAALEPAGLPAETAILSRIAFASCLDQDRPLEILDRLRAEDPDLLLMLGDNVYGDSDDPELVPLRAAYARLARSEPFRDLRAAVPILATWDDHDYGRNDAGAGFEGRAASEVLFDAFWSIDPERAAAGRPGVHDAFVFGPEGRRVQILLLDTRSFRSPLTPSDERGAPGRERYVPEPDPARTMLGEAQWDWLRARLREPAELRVLVSSIQVLADGHGWEAWRTLPLERQRLLDLLAAADGDSLILSGDRHRAGLYRKEIAEGVTLREATSSSLNRPIPGMSEEAGPQRIGPPFTGPNYGMLEVDWEAGVLRVEVRAADGEPVLAQAFPFGDRGAARWQPVRNPAAEP
jgi:alkaline phosphatase D